MKFKRDFVYKGRRCIVIEMKQLGNYCNGYIELKPYEISKNYDDYKIKADEMTYLGDLRNVEGLDIKGINFIGFDSIHYWNDQHPESKTANYVANTCKDVVKEMRSLKFKIRVLGWLIILPFHLLSKRWKK